MSLTMQEDTARDHDGGSGKSLQGGRRLCRFSFAITAVAVTVASIVISNRYKYLALFP